MNLTIQQKGAKWYIMNESQEVDWFETEKKAKARLDLIIKLFYDTRNPTDHRQ